MIKTNSEILLNGFFSVIRDTYQKNNNTFDLDIVKKKNVIATLCILDDYVILVSQYRAPLEDKIFEVVAGHIENNDDINDTIRREVLEEIGYEIESIVDCGSVYTSPGFTTENVHLSISYLGSRVSNGGGLESENEEISICKIPISSFLETKFEDMKTELLRLHLKLNIN